jgi:hypothetical protein
MSGFFWRLFWGSRAFDRSYGRRYRRQYRRYEVPSYGVGGRLWRIVKVLFFTGTTIVTALVVLGLFLNAQP